MNIKIDIKELLDKNRPDLTGKLKSFSSTDFGITQALILPQVF